MVNNNEICARLFLVTMCLLLSGCVTGMQITSPKDGANIKLTAYTAKIPVTVVCNKCKFISIKITLDGVEKTHEFQTTSSLLVRHSPFPHTLIAEGKIQLDRTRFIIARKATVRFRATYSPLGPISEIPVSLSLSIDPRSLLVERGLNKTSAISVGRWGFSDDVRINVRNIPQDLRSNAPFSMAANQLTRQLIITADPFAALRTHSFDVKAEVPRLRLTQQKRLSVQIIPQLGGFTEVFPDYRNILNPLDSPDKNYYLTVSEDGTGNSDYLVQFYKASNQRTVGGQQSFSIANGLGGVGYCPASRFGIILSKYGGGPSSHQVHFLNLTSGSLYTLEPVNSSPLLSPSVKIFTSRDCTLALVAGSLFGPTQQSSLILYDLGRHQIIGRNGFSTGKIKADVRMINRNPNVCVQTDMGTTSEQERCFRVY